MPCRRWRLVPSLSLLLLTVSAAATLAGPGLAPALEAVPADELVVDGYSVTGIRNRGGTLSIGIAAEVTNLDAGAFELVNGTLVGGVPAGVEVTWGELWFGDVDPYGTTPSEAGAAFWLRASTRPAKRAMVRALLLDELQWEFDGNERIVWENGVYELDEETLDLAVVQLEDDFGTFCAFEDWTDWLADRVPGDIVVFVHTEDDNPLSAPEIPWEVVDVVEAGDEVWVYYLSRPDLEVPDLVVSGFLEAAARTGGNGMHQSVFDHGEKTTVCEVLDGEEVCRFAGLYLQNNGLAVGNDVVLDGGFNVTGVDGEFFVRFRSGIATEMGATLTLEHETAVALEAVGAEITPEVETSLIAFSIPVVETSIGAVPLDVEIHVEMLLGAQAEFAGAGEVGLNHRGTVGIQMEVDLAGGDIYSVVPIVEVEPFLSSDPTLEVDAAMHAEAWGAVELSLRLNGGLVGGPSARVEAYTSFDVDPVADPWWTLGAGARVEATLAFEALGIAVASHTYTPMDEVATTVASEEPAHSGTTPLASGETVRWARDYHLGGVYGDLPSDLLALDDGSTLLVGWDPPVLALVSPAGELLWDAAAWGAPLGGAVPFDDGILMVGDYSTTLWIGLVDWNGNPVQDHAWDLGGGLGISGVLQLSGGTTPEFLIYGEYQGGDNNFRAFAARLTYDPSDAVDPLTVHWARSYEGHAPYWYPYLDKFYSAVAVDGDVVLVGSTTTGDGIEFTGYNAAMARLDLDGNVVWANVVGRISAEVLYGVTQGSDGDLVATGAIGQGLLSQPYYHNFWLGSFDPDTGDALGQTTLTEDLYWEWDDLGQAPIYTTPGCSIYDSGHDLVPLADGGFAVVGKTGLGPTYGWVARLAPDLRVRWLATIEGDGHDVASRVVDTGDGIAVLAKTNSPAVNGLGGSNWDLMLFKLPYDGSLAFDDASGMVVRYTKPDMAMPDPVALGDMVMCGIDTLPLSYTIEDLTATAVADSIVLTAAGLTEYDLDLW